MERKSTYHSSRHTLDMNYKTGDQILLRNYKKKLKLDPDYLPDNNNNDWKKVFEFISNNDHVHYDDSEQKYYNTNPIFR